MDFDAYLARIAQARPRAPTPEALAALHVAHLTAVPFENLDIMRGRPLSLDEPALFDKIVRRRRGGFCYELNGLFAALLRHLGYRVTLLSARVARATGGFGPEFDHLALLVELDERWLVDVGFGDSFLEPIRLDARGETRGGSRAYRVDEAGEDLVLLQRGAEWAPQYRFTLEPRALSDFVGMCVHHQTSPDSHFTKRSVCTRVTPEGRVTLSGDRLIVTRGGTREERLLAPGEEVIVLREQLAIELD